MVFAVAYFAVGRGNFDSSRWAPPRGRTMLRRWGEFDAYISKEACLQNMPSPGSIPLETSPQPRNIGLSQCFFFNFRCSSHPHTRIVEISLHFLSLPDGVINVKI